MDEGLFWRVEIEMHQHCGRGNTVVAREERAMDSKVPAIARPVVLDKVSKSVHELKPPKHSRRREHQLRRVGGVED